MTRKVVKSATIEVIPIMELRRRDLILVSDAAAKVKSIDYRHRIVKLAPPQNIEVKFHKYYRIISCKQERPLTICTGCGKMIKSMTDYCSEFCSTTCKDEYDKALAAGEIF